MSANPRYTRYYIPVQDKPRRIVRTVQTALRSLLLPIKTQSSLKTRVFFYVLITNMIVMQIFHVFFMIKHLTDVAVMADTCSTVSTTFQGIIKLISLYFNSAKVRKMIRIVYSEFWPTQVVPIKVRNPLNNLARWSEFLMISFYILIFFCCSLLLIPPLFLGIRELPLASIYPFNWSKAPLYEIMYVWQWFLSLYGVCFVVGTHDFLFVAMMVQLIVQFRMLQNILSQIGSKNEKEIYKSLAKSTPTRQKKYLIKEEEYLLVHCVIHHIKLLNFADIVEQTFSPIVFSQFVESVSGLCLGVFLLNIVNGVNFIKLVFFIIGHLAQLLLYCLFGNEVMYQSVRVADAAFNNNWHLKNNQGVKIGLIMIIQRAQRSKKITALGMADLNIESFIEVLRSSISFSTLLKTFIDKQKTE